MKRLLSIMALLLLTVSCNNMKVGYLDTEYAVYKPNVMTIRKELDMNNPKDKDRFDKKIHWISSAIQGIDGTSPINITIHSVRTEGGGGVEKFLGSTVLRGNGQFDVDFENDIPIGKYIVSIKVKNEGYTEVLNDIFTIEVVSK